MATKISSAPVTAERVKREALALGSNARRDALRTINGAFDVVGYPVTVEGTITASVCHDRG